MIGVLTTQKCAVCNRRLWLILMHDVHALICGPCDMRAAPECEPECDDCFRTDGTHNPDTEH